MRIQDAAPDARHAPYAAIQADPLVARAAALLVGASLPERILARAVMNGERSEREIWRTTFSSLFARGSPNAPRAEAVLDVAVAVAARGDQARNQYRGAIVEALTELLLRRRSTAVRRERRVLFDGVRANIHPYDVTIEDPGHPEVWDCKWGARGIDSDVLDHLDEVRRHAAAEERPVVVGLVVFDARLSCLVRLARLTAPRSEIRLVTIETLDELSRGRPRPATG